MADRVMPHKDAVIVGFGWTGAIMAKELTEAGLKVVALERGCLPRYISGWRLSEDHRRADLSAALQTVSKSGAKFLHLPARHRRSRRCPIARSAPSGRGTALAARDCTGRVCIGACCRRSCHCAGDGNPFEADRSDQFPLPPQKNP